MEILITGSRPDGDDWPANVEAATDERIKGSAQATDRCAGEEITLDRQVTVDNTITLLKNGLESNG